MNPRIQSLSQALALAAGLSIPGALHAQTARPQAKVSQVLPHYRAKVALTGTLVIPTTDALSDLAAEWSRAFKRYQPEGSLLFLNKLTKEALQPFQAGTSNLVLLARDMSPTELQEFKAHFGYLPIRIPICIDANIVIVNKENPITSISMEQLDAIFSKSRLGGAPAPAVVWGDLGVRGELAKRPINAYSRPEGTASRASIASMVLLNGAFRTGIIDKVDSSDLAEAVSMDAAGIAIGPLAAWYSTNKTLPVTPYRGTEPRFPSQELVTNSMYPMPRLYYAYLNRAPGKPVDAAAGEALNFILSQEGQALAAEAGLMPGPVEFITMALKRLNQ